MSRGLALMMLSIAIAGAPLRAQNAPLVPPESAAPAPPPAEPAIDRLEAILWQAAAVANSESAYGTYLNRYPSGPHAEEARAAIDRLKRFPSTAAPADATAVRPEAPVAASIAPAEPPPFVCRPVYAGEPPFEQAAEAEIAAYLQAIRVNSLGSYQTYLAAFPNGVFAPEVAEAIAARQGRMAALGKGGGPGPAAARVRVQVAPGEADYPSIAMRDAREGQATAIWEVAEDGCVEACRVERSSGSPALDAATCRTITLKGRYDPALDSKGLPVRSVDTATFRWRLPQH